MFEPLRTQRSVELQVQGVTSEGAVLKLGLWAAVRTCCFKAMGIRSIRGSERQESILPASLP